MKVKSYSKFGCFVYQNSNQIISYSLGDVLFRHLSSNEPEIGVVIQTFDNGDVRTDEWGVCSSDDVKLATLEQVKTIRPVILPDIILTRQEIADLLFTDLYSYEESIKEMIVFSLDTKDYRYKYWNDWFTGKCSQELNKY